MQQAHLLISGNVQGVGFRQFVKHKARKAGVTGWVRNISNGSVEAVLQGEKEAVEHIISLCKKGSYLSEVKDVTVNWQEANQTFADFTVVV